MKFNQTMQKFGKAAAVSLMLTMAAFTCDPNTGGGGGSGGNTGSTDLTGVAGGYAVVDTNQSDCYNASSEIACPAAGAAFYGQDAQYNGNQPSYRDNGDGTVSDLVTGLMWQQGPGTATYDGAPAACAAASTGGYSDWRVPTIKELYSIFLMSGKTGTGSQNGGSTPPDAVPYLDTDYFNFYYGTELNFPGMGTRYIDAQYVTSTPYVYTVFNGAPAFFGVNFADGRIKGYPRDPRRSWFLRCVRGNEDYGKDLFADNGDGTITDRATDLMWMQLDSGDLGAGYEGYGMMNWPESLAWCEGLDYAGHSDWRLPDTKELQSIVDYTRSPKTTSSGAINELFSTSLIVDEGGSLNVPFYWTGSTHLDGHDASHAAYVAFGQALGWMEDPPGSGNYTLMDVHGAGAQRSDPKTGDPADYPYGHGPQGDVIRIYNFARCVRDAE